MPQLKNKTKQNKHTCVSVSIKFSGISKGHNMIRVQFIIELAVVKILSIYSRSSETN